MSRNDFPWCHELFSNAYPAGTYDPVEAEAWFGDMLRDPGRLLLRGDNAFSLSSFSRLPFLSSSVIGRLHLLVSNGRAGMELVKHVRAAANWCKDHGAGRFFFDSIEGVDFRAIAKRLGGKPYGPNYVLELK